MKNGTIWLTGAGGLIGNCLLQSAPVCLPGATIVPLTRDSLDLSDSGAIKREFQRNHPQLVMHCAAISKSAACQANPDLARKVNVDATALLAQLAADIPFIFISTDLIFDGRTGNYDESASPNPLSLYAETKVLAEKHVLANPRHTVIRTSLNGGVSPTGDRGFNEELRRTWESGKPSSLFTDEFRSPIAARVTALALWELIALDAVGLFHLAGAERLSRWQIGQLLSARWPQLSPRLEPASLKSFQGPPRSPDTSLNSSRVQRLLSFPLPGLTDWLKANPQEVF